MLEEVIPPGARAGLMKAGWLSPDPSVDDLRRALARIETEFRDKAPLSPAEAAAIILDGVRSGSWRILVGKDASLLDAAIRANPEAAYDYPVLFAAAARARDSAR
jgi:hypothetical protein